MNYSSGAYNIIRVILDRSEWAFTFSSGTLYGLSMLIFRSKALVIVDFIRIIFLSSHNCVLHDFVNWEYSPMSSHNLVNVPALF